MLCASQPPSPRRSCHGPGAAHGTSCYHPSHVLHGSASDQSTQQHGEGRGGKGRRRRGKGKRGEGRGGGEREGEEGEREGEGRGRGEREGEEGEREGEEGEREGEGTPSSFQVILYQRLRSAPTFRLLPSYSREAGRVRTFCLSE